EGALTDIGQAVVEVGEADVGGDALVLSAFPGDTVELGAGDLDLPLGHGDELLHRALAVGLAAQHQAALVVLNGAGEDLGGRSAEAVHQDGQGTVIDDGRVGVALYDVVTVGVANLHRGAAADEQAHQRVGFGQGAAAVVAQVHHHAVHLLGLQLLEQPTDITRAAAVVGVARLQGLEIDVEGGQLDDADLQAAALVLNLDDLLLGGLLLQLHGVPGDAVDLRFQALRLGRNDLQAHRAALLAPDQLHHVVDAPADHVGELAVALGHAHDTVGRLELARLLSGAAAHQADH